MINISLAKNFEFYHIFKGCSVAQASGKHHTPKLGVLCLNAMGVTEVLLTKMYKNNKLMIAVTAVFQDFDQWFNSDNISGNQQLVERLHAVSYVVSYETEWAGSLIMQCWAMRVSLKPNVVAPMGSMVA